MAAVIAMTVVAFYGPKPAALGGLLGAAQHALGAVLGTAFRPRPVDVRGLRKWCCARRRWLAKDGGVTEGRQLAETVFGGDARSPTASSRYSGRLKRYVRARVPRERQPRKGADGGAGRAVAAYRAARRPSAAAASTTSKGS